MRYKITGSNQYKYANKKCCSIYNYYQWYIYLHRCHVDIVCRRIEFDKSCMYLYKYKPNTYNVAKDQTASNNEDCKPKECTPYSGVGRSKSFKRSYHLSAFEYYYEQSGYHSKASHTYH